MLFDQKQAHTAAQHPHNGFCGEPVTEVQRLVKDSSSARRHVSLRPPLPIHLLDALPQVFGAGRRDQLVDESARDVGEGKPEHEDDDGSG